MPELPETETIARDLHGAVAGRFITDVHVRRDDVLRGVSARTLRRRVRGAQIERCWRRAKLVVLDLRGGDRLVVQPRFTGALLLDAGALPEAERRYSTMAFTLDDGRLLHYRDIRRLGTVSLMSSRDFAEYAAALGPEPLDPSFTVAQLAAVLGHSRQAIKKVLMDQRRIVGIGNIYAGEALWRAAVSPEREARALAASDVGRLHEGIVGVLTASVALRGTSFRDYRDANGERGRFAEHLAVYGRAGKPCLRCGAALHSTHAIDGRATVWCGACQR